MPGESINESLSLVNQKDLPHAIEIMSKRISWLERCMEMGDKTDYIKQQIQDNKFVLEVLKAFQEVKE